MALNEVHISINDEEPGAPEPKTKEASEAMAPSRRGLEFPNYADSLRPVHIDGKEVPGLRAQVDREGHPTMLVLDQRLALDLPRDPYIAEATVRFIADAIAVGLGFPSFTTYERWPSSRRQLTNISV